ncbi:MAG: cyclic nucleotide-binding domain-containing protein [Nannocystales bacterium]
MSWFSRLASALADGSAFSFSGLGVLTVGLLILALRFTLLRGDRDKLRTPTGALVVHLALVVMGAIVDPASTTASVLKTLAVLFLLLAGARTGFLLVVDNILTRRLARPIPKIFRDICEGLVYSAAVLLTLRSAGAQLDALLTTSALLTAVIGLSLQDTLGNLFAGLSIQAQNPFEVGDWIQYDSDENDIGKVIEINWRATKVLTLDDVEIVIPNGPLARAPIRNFTKPTKMSRRSLFVVVPFSEPPHRVQDVILEGLQHTPGVLRRPAPSVVTSDFVERGVRYWVRFHTDDFERREVTDSLARDRIWYSLRRANIQMAVPVADLELHQDDESYRSAARSEAMARRRAALRNVDFLRDLSDEQVDELVASCRERPYAPGETILQQGDEGDELFIVQRGEVEVLLETDGHSVEVARLGKGAFFGEMSLMTGQPRMATIRTLTETLVLVVSKTPFARVLDGSPELAEQISDVLVSRREQLDSASSKQSAPRVSQASTASRNELLHRIKDFFSLSS